jgi:hypothetical protein
MDDRLKDSRQNDQSEGEGQVLTRRKLVYVAPILMSRRLFYRAAGCGKVDPLKRNCAIGHVKGS